MNKCDFCEFSRPNPNTGHLQCTCNTCIMTRSELEKIAALLGGGRKK